MSWRFALFLGGIAGVTVYVVCYVMTHYLGELPVLQSELRRNFSRFLD